jgi:hypothetical protein
MMPLLRKAHLGEVTVSVWPKVLEEICAKKNIYVLDEYEKISECGQSVKALTEPVARFFWDLSLAGIFGRRSLLCSSPQQRAVIPRTAPFATRRISTQALGLWP